MPLRVTTVAKQRSVAALAKSIFAVSDDDQLKRAEDALVRANPELAADKLAAGTVIVVPDTPGLATTDAVQSTNLVGGAIADLAPDRLTMLIGSVGALGAAAAARAKTDQAQLKATDFVAAFAEAHPALPDALAEVASAIDADTRLLTERAGQVTDALKLIGADQARAAARGMPIAPA